MDRRTRTVRRTSSLAGVRRTGGARALSCSATAETKQRATCSSRTGSGRVRRWVARGFDPRSAGVARSGVSNASTATTRSARWVKTRSAPNTRAADSASCLWEERRSRASRGTPLCRRHRRSSAKDGPSRGGLGDVFIVHGLVAERRADRAFPHVWVRVPLPGGWLELDPSLGIDVTPETHV